MNLINETFSEISGALNNSRSMFNKIRVNSKEMTDDIFGRSLNITIPLIQQIINMKSMFGKINGTITTTIYTLFGSYLALNAFIKALPDLILSLILIPLTAIIASLWGLSWITFGATIPPALAFTAIYSLIAITILIITDQLRDVLDTGNPDIEDAPDRPSCFHPDTLIKTYDGDILKMTDLKSGMKLKNGQIVYATMNIHNLDENNKYNETLYNISDGENNKSILVSGSHLIFDSSTKNFVQIKDYSNCEKSNINSDKLVCLITSDHTIPLGIHIFHDWEDNHG